GGEHDVVLRDPAHALVNHAYAHLGVLNLLQLGDRGFDRPDHVALEHEIEVLDGAFLDLLEERFERDADSALSELLAAQALATHLCVAAGLALVLDDAALFARGRRMVEAENLDRIAGHGLLDLLAAEVVERAHLAPGV